MMLLITRITAGPVTARPGWIWGTLVLSGWVLRAGRVRPRPCC
jgi:hypothetical protein